MSSTNRGAERRIDDAYETPQWCVRRLLEVWQPREGVLVEPCCGSTGKAASLERFAFTGIEQDADFCEIARARIAWAEAHRTPEQLALLGEP